MVSKDKSQRREFLLDGCSVLLTEAEKEIRPFL